MSENKKLTKEQMAEIKKDGPFKGVRDMAKRINEYKKKMEEGK